MGNQRVEDWLLDDLRERGHVLAAVRSRESGGNLGSSGGSAGDAGRSRFDSEAPAVLRRPLADGWGCGPLIKRSSGSNACAEVQRMERVRSLGRTSLQSLQGPDELQRCSVKMPAKEAVALLRPPRAAAGEAPARRPAASSYTADRIQVPKGNGQAMAKLVDALRVANDLHKSGALSKSAYDEMCKGIQEEMDSLVCLWVPTRQ